MGLVCILSICSSVQRRLRCAREHFRSASLARSTIIWVFSSVSSAATSALAPFRKSCVSLPNAPSLSNICGDVSLPYLEGSAQRMLLPKTDHQEHFTREGHNDRVYSGFVLSSKVALSRFCRTPTTLQGSSTFFFMASGDAFSHVGLLFGSPDESAAALHIASGDVQNGFHHMGIPQWLRPCSCLRPLSARAFGMTGMIVQGSRVSAEQKLFLAPLTLPMRFSRRMFFCQHVGVQQENCSDLS